LLKMADLSLYAAKQTDRGAVRLYSNDIASLFERRSSAIELVRGALDQKTLIPFYQPKICLKTSVCFGFEALARIRSPDGAVIGPQAFAAAFQDRAMARRVGKRMLTEVVNDIAAWKGQGLGPISVSLNASEYDFGDGSFAVRVLRALEEHDVPTTWLTIEVTESVFLGAKACLAREALVALDAAGVQIELDDFGTGYASLTHLRSIPVSRLKIDRSFIENICEDESSSAIVQAVIDMGHRLGCEIIAEGVELDDQAEKLRHMGCDSGQGYLFGRPMPQDSACRLLSTPRAQQSALLRSYAAKRNMPVATTETEHKSRLIHG
jgi:EAL domain-containing protein (putative c-di-GMP-specific phosphodiesterase class I)